MTPEFCGGNSSNLTDLRIGLVRADFTVCALPANSLRYSLVPPHLYSYQFLLYRRLGKRTSKLWIRPQFTPTMHILRSHLPQRNFLVLFILRSHRLCKHQHPPNTSPPPHHHQHCNRNRNNHTHHPRIVLSPALHRRHRRHRNRVGRSWCRSRRITPLPVSSQSKTVTRRPSITTKSFHSAHVLWSIPRTKRVRDFGG